MAGRAPRYLAAFGVAVASGSEVASAHGGALSGVEPARLAVPSWLFLLTGGAVVAVSVLLASFVTDPDLIEPIRTWDRVVTADRLRDRLAATGRVAGLVGVAVVVAGGLVGPTAAVREAAALAVWAGWWAGYTTTVFLVGNTWPAVDPVAGLSRPFEAGVVEYPERLGSWPATISLFGLVWAALGGPLASGPRALALGVVGYLLIGIVGAGLLGPRPWFRYVDPIAAVFRQFGRLAPVQRTAGGIRFGLPGSALASVRPSDPAEIGLVVVLLWGTTFDGFVHTPLWTSLARTAVGAGLPVAVVYPLALLAGVLAFAATFWLAARVVRRIAPTCRGTAAIAGGFAPSLVPIAAGYHLAHSWGYLLAVAPSLPGWVSGLPAAFVVGGHLLAVWVAHGIAFDRFPSRVQAIRSQYPITVAMVAFTVVGLWVVTQPAVVPPYR